MLVDLQPHVGPLVVRMHHHGVRAAGALFVDNEPGLDGFQVPKRRENGTIPVVRHATYVLKIDERNAQEDNLQDPHGSKQ